MLIVDTEVLESEHDTVRMRDQVRVLTGRPNAEVVGVRKVVDKEGKTVGFQVDIR